MRKKGGQSFSRCKFEKNLLRPQPVRCLKLSDKACFYMLFEYNNCIQTRAWTTVGYVKILAHSDIMVIFETIIVFSQQKHLSWVILRLSQEVNWTNFHESLSVNIASSQICRLIPLVNPPLFSLDNIFKLLFRSSSSIWERTLKFILVWNKNTQNQKAIL